MRNRILAFIAYEILWFAIVIAAGHGRGGAALAFGVLFVAGQLAITSQRTLAIRLLVAGVLLGAAVDGGAAWLGLIAYASPWPIPVGPPGWILGLWGAFAITLVGPLNWLVGHPAWAAALGALGGPLSYAGAQRGWGAISVAPPGWHGYAWLAVGWALAMALLSVVPQGASRGAPAIEGQR